MKKWIMCLVALCLVAVPVAQAEVVTSGFTSVDLESYTPGSNAQPFPILSNVLGNPGFETGSLPPWTTDAWTVINTDMHSGSYSAQGITNVYIMQTFAPIPVGQINSVTMWSKQPSGLAFQAVDFFYSAVDFDEFLVSPGVDWTFIDMTSHLRGSGSLEAIRAWSYMGSGDQTTRIDDVNIDAEGGVPTDLTSWGRIKELYR